MRRAKKNRLKKQYDGIQPSQKGHKFKKYEKPWNWKEKEMEFSLVIF